MDTFLQHCMYLRCSPLDVNQFCKNTHTRYLFLNITISEDFVLVVVVFGRSIEWGMWMSNHDIPPMLGIVFVRPVALQVKQQFGCLAKVVFLERIDRHADLPVLQQTDLANRAVINKWQARRDFDEWDLVRRDVAQMHQQTTNRIFG